MVSRDTRIKFTKLVEYVSMARPLKLRNISALGQTMHEKIVTKMFYTLQYFGAPDGPPRSKFTNLGTDVQQGPDYQCAVSNFVPF